MKIRRIFLSLALSSLFVTCISAQGGQTEVQLQEQRRVSGHHGPVRAIAISSDMNSVLTSGSDGFVVEWDVNSTAAIDRYQLSPYDIVSLAVRPEKEELAIVETDGLGLYRVSAWNYREKQKLFTLRFKDPVTFITYSAAGSFLIVARSAQNGIVILDPTNGSIRRSPQDLIGPLAFAATGKSEKTMIAYSSSGSLSYWDLSSGAKLKEVAAPSGIKSPSLFGNNRFFGGIDSKGLVIVDALSGGELARAPIVHGSVSIAQSNDSQNLIGIDSDGLSLSLKILSATPEDSQSFAPSSPIILPSTTVPSAVALNGSILIGLQDGGIGNLDEATNIFSRFTVRNSIQVSDAAITDQKLIATTDDGYLVLPSILDAFMDGATYPIIGDNGEDRCIPSGNDRFVLWKTDGSIPPVVCDDAGRRENLSVPIGTPFRTGSVYGSKALFLDTIGTITIVSLETTKQIFAFSSLGLLDATFLNERRILAGKSSAVPPAAPILSIDIVTGETVPVELSGTAAVRVYRGKTGTVYTMVTDTDSSGPKTSIIKLDLMAPNSSRNLVEYRAEDVSASITETAGSVATTLGGDGASIYGSEGFSTFERTSALPKRLADGESFIIAVDSDGGLSWHDPMNGKVEAVFHLYQDGWEFQRGATVFKGKTQLMESSDSSQ